MDILVRGLNVGLSAEDRAHIERRIEFALDRFAQHIARVEVRLSDANGPKGGVDKRCQIFVRPRHQTPRWVDAVHSDLRAAADLGADRIARSLARELGRGRGPVRASSDRWMLSLARYERLPEEAVG